MGVQYKASEHDAPILQDITRHIDQSLGGWYGSASELISQTPEVRSYTNSFLLRYGVRTQAGSKVILVKIRRNPKMESLKSAITARELHGSIPDEYNTLQFVHERIGDGHANFTAIRPLTYLQEYFAIVMEEFPSRSLRQLLYQQRRSGNTSELMTAARRAGELLRFFHEKVHSVIESPYSSSDFLTHVESFASRLETYTRGRITSGSIVNAFARRLSTRELRSIPFSAAHQDMTSDNILYSDATGKVCLIDIRTKPAPIYSDLALLLVHPETYRDQIFRAGRFFSRELLREYRDSILTGYFGGGSTDRFLVDLFCAMRILDKWTMHEDLFHRYKRWKRVFTRPLAPFVTAYFRRELDRYLTGID